jgi:predicted PurR-regulated permease PerM
MNLSFQKLFYTLATVIAFFAILILAKSILIPLGFALFISFILFPLTKKFESFGINKILSAFLSILTVILIIGGGIFLFSTQLIELSKELSNFQDRIIQAFADVTLYINKNVNIISNLGKNELSDKIKDWLNESTGTLVSKTFTTTATFLAGLLGTIIFTFLILIYRHGLTQALMGFSPEDKRERVIKMFKSVQQVGQKYLSGMILFLPFAAMLKVFCEEYEELKPIALLIGNHNYKENNGGVKFIKRRFTKVQDWFSKFRVGFKKNSGDKQSDKSIE